MRASLLYLSRADVEAVSPSTREVVEVVEALFREKGEGLVEMPPKPGVHPRPDAFLHAMPAYLRRSDAVGLKWVSGFPANPGRGLATIHGLLLLNDPDTGAPVAVMDATWITAARTAGATAVAARRLARGASRSLGILGCGVQGRAHLETVPLVLPSIMDAYFWDPDPAALGRFEEEMTRRHCLRLHRCEGPRQVVQASDVLVTAGPILRHPRPPIEATWLAPGVFVCTLDFDSYLAPGAFAAADRLYTDDLPQLDHYRREGFFAGLPQGVEDLGALVACGSPGRRHDGERLVAVNLGLAAEDVALGTVVLGRARERGLGTVLPL
ncbi:MAG: ornithine cyclodeaminase family protein [Planctomycetes bacterium]|nr:ornithine cyclodeaminase family protein [Planctomycetota bacterium]